MKISFIVPSRNNLKYLKWSYASVRKNQGDHEVQFCVADDASEDGTWAWCVETEKADPNFKWMRNHGPSRLGHTILYDRLVKEVATNELCMIWHADMYLCPGALDAVEKHMYSSVHTDHVPGGFDTVPNERTIVSLTRIEPPLHPAGPEKILRDFGTEPENFRELDLLQEWSRTVDSTQDAKTTNGVFAPWAFWKQEFLEIGGHDPLFAPQSKEDSDIWNRFSLNGTKFIQTWEGFVYHLTCRGSRFNPTQTTVGTNSVEWERQNLRSYRNFLRKWGSPVLHNQYMLPIVPPKFKVAVVVEEPHCLSATHQYELITALEPCCGVLYGDFHTEAVAQYIENEQEDTPYPLKDRIKRGAPEPSEFDVLVKARAHTIGSQEVHHLQALPQIIQQEIIHTYAKRPSESAPLLQGDFALGAWVISVNIASIPDNKDLITNVQPVNWKNQTMYRK